MKIITFSDLHLEFGIDFRSPEDSAADVMVLAGDIITFRDYDPLSRFLESWHKPVIFVAALCGLTFWTAQKKRCLKQERR